MRQSLLFFNQITKNDSASAGGKGASLGELTQLKLPVPKGFVIIAKAFDDFFHTTGLSADIQSQLEHINYKDINSVDRYSNVIRDMIARTPFPRFLSQEVMQAFKKLKSPYVAVRSSATVEDSKEASWAGELETYLNTTEKELTQNVKKCWSSLFTPRALFYRHEKHPLSFPLAKGKFKDGISVAVVVQKMVQSEISGIAFTVHPVTKDKNQIIIEAGWGLGEAVVSGHITPDSYIIDKRARGVIDINKATQIKKLVQKNRGGDTRWVAVEKKLQAKQKLTDEQVKNLANICLLIEKHYGFPCDIEWAWSKKKFYITQCRPITTL